MKNNLKFILIANISEAEYILQLSMHIISHSAI